MKTVQGDLLQLALDGEFDVIVHGCNCFCTMGSGIANQIRLKFPEAWKADQQTKPGDIGKLGGYSFARLERNKKVFTVINAYTQYNYHGAGVLADYKAIRNAFKGIRHLYQFVNYRIGYPKIGAGLARGDWTIISGIINQELKGMDHTLVEYNG